MASVGELQLLSTVKCYGGYLKRYSHQSRSTNCEMKFIVYLPPKAEVEKVPVLWFLSGLTCNDENFIVKSAAWRDASQYGIALISPDTSPRGCNVEGESADWDFGVGAGFYLNATEPKWKTNWNMYSYITEELWGIVNANFPVLQNQHAITGHSMGGHGALICGLKNPGKYKSVSAFAPISNPMNCPWGIKAFTGYLGDNKETWKAYDATHLVSNYKGPKIDILIDQGTGDKFYVQKQLLPENFKSAAEQAGIPVELRMQDGYDHSYYFIATFLPDHMRFHALHLNNKITVVI